MQQPQVSIIIPTYGRRAAAVRLLKSLAHQTVAPGTFEVIVVCDGDVDGTAQACRSLVSELPFRLRVIEQTNQGRAAARNRGVAEARSSLLLFLDDDIEPEEGLVAAHMAAQSGQVGLVTIGSLLPPPDSDLNLWEAWEADRLGRNGDAMKTGRWNPTYRQFYTGNACMSRQSLLDAGGFDTSFSRNEDVELAYRLHLQGNRFVGVAEACGSHYVTRSLASFVDLAETYGAAEVDLARTGCPVLTQYGVDEYRRRHPAIRMLVQFGAGRPMACSVGLRTLGLAARVLTAAGLAWRGRILASLIFNLAYYHALAEELGGRTAFQDWLRRRDVGSLLQSATQPETSATG